MPIIAAGLLFACTPVAVWDGDGPVWCEEGPRVRLGGIAARETDGTCRSNQPCPDVSAIEARDALVAILGGPRGKMRTGHIRVRAPTMECRSTGSAGGTRTGAWCQLADGRDLSCTMVATGTVLRWRRYWRDHHRASTNAGHPIKIGELTDIVLAAGHVLGGQDQKSNLAGYLSRDPRVVTRGRSIGWDVIENEEAASVPASDEAASSQTEGGNDDRSTLAVRDDFNTLIGVSDRPQVP